jgi:PAS domain S-box-containing protein
MVQDDSLKRGKQTDNYSSHLSDNGTQGNHGSFRMSDPFFQQVIDGLEDYALFTIDKDSNISSWNSGAQHLFGYAEEEIIGQNAAILFIPEDRQKNAPEKELEAAIKKGRGKDEKWHLRKDGSKFWASGLIFPLKDEEGNLQGFTKIARDLTEKKRYEEERKALLQELEAEKRNLVDVFERAPAFMAILRGKDHVFEMANTAYYQLVGHREIIGKSVIEAIPEVKEQGFIEILDTVLATGQPFIGTEMPLGLQRIPNGVVEERYLNFVYEPLRDTKNNRIGIVVHGYDVTDQVVARQKVEESEARLRFMADSMPQQVWTATPDGALDYVNQYAVNYFNKSAEEIVGEGWQKVIHPDDLPECIQLWTESLTTGKPYQVFFRLRKSDNTYRWHLGRALPLTDEKKVLKWFGTNTDVDDQKKLERQKDEFMAIVSHELKTPVTSIKAFTQVLQNRFTRAGDEKSAALLGKMDAQINKLTSLIGDLLDVTKIEGGQLQFNKDYFSFDELVEEVVEQIQRTTQKHTIEKLGATNKTVHGDKDRIEQVIINFLTNAIKYSPHSDIIVVKSLFENDQVTFCVQDFGVGIPEERHHQVFERFYRVSGNETIPGIGLGLYISAEIIKRQNGKIWVESEPGKGSTFCFSLPISQ